MTSLRLDQLTLVSTVIFFCIFFRHFDLKNKDDATEAAMLFSVPDFVGDACKAIASRVRGSVASVQFDDFHKVRDFVPLFLLGEISPWRG